MGKPEKQALEEEINDEDKKRFEELFEKLDINKDGVVDIEELTIALKTGVISSDREAAGHAKDIVALADSDENSEIDISEFMKYMANHEKKLKLAFNRLDRNNDGQIDPSEIQATMAQLGVIVDEREACSLLKKLDKDSNLSIDYEEWREFFQFCHSVDDLDQLLSYWRNSRMIDIGDQLTCPPEFTRTERQSGTWWRILVAGGFAGAVSRTCTAPLDRIKIMFQVHGVQQSEKGVLGALRSMVKEGGVHSLWRGNGVNVIKIAPESAIKFAAYEQVLYAHYQIKKAIVGENKPISLVERFAAGSTAGAISQSTIYPLEVIKTRLAVATSGQYRGIFDCGIKLVRKEGIRALYKGYLPNMIGIIPYAGIDLSVYETLKTHYIQQNPENTKPGVLTLLACGTISSTCGQLCSYPLALSRTRLQAQGANGMGLASLLTNIVQTEGFTGLYRGLLPNFLKVLPAVSISYVIYEHAKHQMGIP